MASVRVRIAVAISDDGHWSAIGWDGDEDEMLRLAGNGMEYPRDCYVFRWIEADVPIPEGSIIEGKVDG